MAHLDPLATVADLDSRGIDVTDLFRVGQFLAAASDEVRAAAGVPITRATWTATVPGANDQWLTVPGQPVVAVEDVEIDGAAVTDWKLVGGDLWRGRGWQPCTPSNVTLTVTGGLVEIPADIVDLVCSMVGYALHQSTEGGYAARGDQIAVRIDDYSEQYATPGASTTAGPMELPEATRRRLRARFGGGVSVARQR